MKVDYCDLGLRIREARRKADMTQEELAEKMGISTSFLGHMERGSRNASLDTLVLLCNTLHVSPQELLAGSLEDEFDSHLPETLTSEERRKMRALFRLAQDAVTNWEEDPDE